MTLRGYRLLLARATVVAVAIPVVSLFLLAVPREFVKLKTVCPTHSVCRDWQLTPADARSLRALGIGLDVYAAYAVALTIVFAVAYCAVAAVIAWRKSDERMALFSALTLVTFGVATFTSSLDVLAGAASIWRWPVTGLDALGSAAIVPFFYLFPDGRFVPRWSRWIAGLWILSQGAWYAFRSSVSSSHWFFVLSLLLFVGALGFAVYAQIYRYRHVSNPLQRQQTKVVVFGTAVALGGYLGVKLGTALLLPFIEGSALAGLLVSTVQYVVMLLIPLSIGVAILRYRLWDIDLLINKVLVYGALTATLAGLYVGSVIVLIQVLRGVTGQQSTVAIVIATLGMAALVQPLRRRLQTGIDRRFYRRKYDATQALATFSARLRDEVDLTTVTANLLALVDQTVQPTHASLWLREPALASEPEMRHAR